MYCSVRSIMVRSFCQKCMFLRELIVLVCYFQFQLQVYLQNLNWQSAFEMKFFSKTPLGAFVEGENFLSSDKLQQSVIH